MSGDPYFSYQKQILVTIISTLSKNEQKNQEIQQQDSTRSPYEGKEIWQFLLGAPK